MRLVCQKNYTSLLLLVFVLLQLLSDAQIADCSKLKTGTFYYYPKNSSDFFIDIRNDNYLHETNASTGDSSVYEIKWTDDCTYSLKYVSGSEKMSDETLQLLKKHKLVYQIIAATKDYYLFKGYLDKTNTQPLAIDTMWLNIKTGLVNNELFKQEKNPSELKRSHFSDTSKYAVLYLYRPGKLANSLGNYLVYFDESIMCIAKNNSGYIFKILKEGKFTLKSRIYKDEADLPLDIKFGSTYYVKSSIPGGIHGLNNYKLKMELMKPEDGQNEFFDVDLQ